MADLATMLHHPHPMVRQSAGLAARARGLLSRERSKKEDIAVRGIETGVAAGTAALAAVLDHYFGGTDGEINVGGFPVMPVVGLVLSGGAFFFGGDSEWADYAAAAGDALLAVGTYGWVKSLLQAQAGGTG